MLSQKRIITKTVSRCAGLHELSIRQKLLKDNSLQTWEDDISYSETQYDLATSC